MTWEMAVVMLVITVMMALLVKEAAPPSYILLGALGVLLVTGILTPAEAVRGFYNEGMLTIGLLCIVAGSVQKTGLAERFIEYVMNKGSTARGSLFRILVPSSVFSAFLNNTPIVAAFTPIVRQWCEKHDTAPSKFLLPISYATIAGGTMTLIGTSTNLVIHGMLVEQGYGGFSFFQLAVIGVPVTVVLILFMTTVGMNMLPDRVPSMPYYSGDSGQKRFSAEMIVQKGGAFEGKTLRQAGLYQENGLRLTGIIREKKVVTDIRHDYVLKEGDRLLLSGSLHDIADLEKRDGFRLDTGSSYELDGLRRGENRLLEVVVTHYSSILFKQVKDILFPRQFDAALLGVHRHRETPAERMKDVTIKPGDTLLLLAGPDFERKTGSRNEFTVLHGRGNPFEKLPSWKAMLPVFLLAAMVLSAASGVISIFAAASAAVFLVLLLKIVPPGEVKEYIPFQVLIVIAAALGIGEAMLKTGAAAYLAETLMAWTAPFGLLGSFILLYIITNVCTEMITNNAAALIMLPVSLETAHLLDTGITPFAVIVAVAASASFMTPIGYQTNLFVYGQGGYRFVDFLKTGAPVSLIVMSVTISITWLVWV
ncbi:SLC13 family permease [Salibacterium sp. K-3]